jgi:hypothetical protein
MLDPRQYSKKYGHKAYLKYYLPLLRDLDDLSHIQVPVLTDTEIEEYENTNP